MLLREAIFSSAITNTSCEVQGKNFDFAPRFERESALHFGEQRLAREQAARAEQVRAANAQEAARQRARLARRQKKHGIAPE
jgi:hypothetical protein